MRIRQRAAVLGAIGAVVMGAGVHAGGAPSAAAAAQATPSLQPASVAPEIATTLARIAGMDLAASNVVTTRDYAIAAEILEIAHDLAPGDEEVLRRLIEARTGSGERTRVLELLPRLLAMDPRDTVTQLRLISGRIMEMQNSDARLAAYERFLGEGGKKLDASVLSRLALDAALLLRERGDERGFAARLATAIELDPSNKDAASLAVAFCSQRMADPMGRLELLLTLFRADPLDPETHLGIARELSAAGAYAAAGRSYAMSQALFQIYGVPVGAELQAEMQLAAWNAEGAEPLLTSVRDAIQKQRQTLHNQREQAMAQGAIESDLPQVTDIQLSMPVAEVLLTAAAALRDEGAIEWAMAELSLASQSVLAPRPGENGQEATPPDEGTVRSLFANVLWLRLLSGQQMDLVGQQMETLRKAEGINADAMARLEGWHLLRQGEFEKAEERLRPLADHDPRALLGLAVAAEAQGDTAAAAAWYTDLSQRGAGTIVGAYARTRAAALAGADPAPPAHAERMAAMAEAGVPRWAEEMLRDPRAFMSVAVEPEPMAVDGAGRVGVRVRLRNTSPIPLAVGPIGPIGSRLLLTPTVEHGMDRAAGMPTMEVVSVDRRLRLMPQEAVEVLVHPEMGSLWYVLNQLGDKTVRLRWRVLQGFRLTEQGVFVEGPLGLSAESGVQIRQPLEMAMMDTAAIIGAIRAPETAGVGTAAAAERLHAALEGLGWRWGAPPEAGGLTPADAAPLAEALADRYARSGRAERLVILAMTPPATQLPVMAPVDIAAREDRDPAAQALVLVTRVTTADDPLLIAAAASGDARLGALASMVAERLASGVSTLARPVRPGNGGAPP